MTLDMWLFNVLFAISWHTLKKKNNFTYLAFNFHLVMFPFKEKIIKIILCKKGMTKFIKS